MSDAEVDVRILQLRSTQLIEEVARLKGGGPGGTSGDVTEDWKASVDRQLEQLHKDVRDLLRGLIGVAVFFLFAVGGLYLFINAKADALTEKVGAMQVEQTHTADKVDEILRRLPPPKP